MHTASKVFFLHSKHTPLNKVVGCQVALTDVLKFYLVCGLCTYTVS